MGGLGPGIGGFEILVIGIVALLVVGPKDLPMLMRKVGQFVGKARAMANEFRASFDEMARQSELDELRKEVEALRSGQGMYALGAEADEAFKDIRKELEAPLGSAPETDAAPETPTEPAPVATGVDEWPDAAVHPETPKIETPKPAAKPRAKKPAAEAKSSSLKPPASRPKVKRTKKVDL